MRETLIMLKDARNILFDLDGTIIEPKEGITKSLIAALNALGCHAPAADDLEWCIGPPIRDNFAKLLQTTDKNLIERGVALYRETYSKIGITQNDLYPGVYDLLSQLQAEGRRLFIATSKPEVYARLILEHMKLDGFFQTIYGAHLDGSLGEKTELLAHIISQENISPGTAVMIGDRKYDILAAKAHGLFAIGVVYGYGVLEEFEGADAVCETAFEVGQVLTA